MPSNTAWARSVATTITNHLRDEEVAVLRATKLGALIESRGQVTTDLPGLGVDWRVQYRLHPMMAVTGTLPPNFTPQNLWKVPQLETRGYQVTDAINKKEFRENRGTQAIVRVFQGMVPRLTRSMKQQFGREFYVDGNAIGNENRIHGVESFMQYNGTIDLSAADNTSRSANQADLVAFPNDTYCGLNTNLGDAGGTYSSAPVGSVTNTAQAIASHWPNGDVDPEYDYWSPVVVNYTSTNFNGSTHDFKGQGLEAMRFGLLQTERNMPGEGESNDGIDVILLARNLLKDVLVQLDSTQRSMVTSETGLRSFGFKHVFEFDGTEVSTEYYVPNGVGYGFNVGCMELMSLNSTLFDVDGPEWDINTQSYKVIVDFLGNLKFDSPRNFFKLAPVA